MLVTFEGIDSSGKSTQARMLVERLRQGFPRPVHFIREPGGTPASERIRTILLDASLPELGDVTELFLFAASRAQLVRDVILPALRRDEIVVCDRFADSLVAYQGYGRRIDLDAIARINALATQQTEPDLTILVDITVAESAVRKVREGKGLDRMEQAGREFYERVRDGYLALAREQAHRFILVDGMRDVHVIEEEIRFAVEERLGRLTREIR